jgi:hypothetical protein
MEKNNFSFYDTSKYKISLSFSLSIFFFCFIIFFLPFGVDNYNPNHQYTFDFFLEIFYFFVPLLAFSLLNELILRPFVFKETTFKKIILWSIWTLFLLSTIIFITYNILGNWHNFKLSSYLEFLVQVPVVLLFPLVGTFFFFRFRSLQYQIEHILTTKERFLDENQLIEFKGQGSKDQITLTLVNFLYGKSQDNYVELYYLENEQLKKFLIRSPLSKLSKSINNSVIVRCHRSYMVNLLQVTAVKGGNNGMTLNIDHFDTIITVSKSYQDSTLESLHKIKNFA